MRLSSSKVPAALGFLLLTLFYLADFYSDVRGRDAFTWMDPHQYFSFAREFLAGAKRFNQFELPSVFPFFVALPMLWRPTVPAALRVNLLFFFALLAAIHRLSRRLAPGQPAPLVAACVLASPLLLGLSRELYIEFALSGLVAMQYVLWMESERFTRRTQTLLFAVLLALGCMTKITYPLYLAGPFIVEAVFLWRERRGRGIPRMALLFLAAGALALAIEYVIFRTSFTYYLRWGYTRLPVMRLIGPLGILSWDSISYGIRQIGLTLLFLLAALLLVPLWVAVTNPRFRADREILLVAAWFLAPPVLLIFQEVKEPRHLAPCVVPGVLLIFAGFDRAPTRLAARALAALALLLGAYQYRLVATHRMTAPYFLDRPSLVHGVVEAMVRSDPSREAREEVPGALELLRWKYTKNFALTGFEPNMALLFAWHLSPGVAYDLDLLENPPPRRSAVAYESFEDLGLINAFNLYNRRCRWDVLYDTLDRETVLAHADYILARGVAPDRLSEIFPGHRHVFTAQAGRDAVHVLLARSPSSISYRALYARAYLERGHPGAAERAAIYEDLCMDAALRGDRERLKALEAERALNQEPGVERKSIYHTANVLALRDAARALRQVHE